MSIAGTSNTNAKPAGWNVGNTQTGAKPAGSQNVGWNVGNTGNTQTGAKPAGTQNIGWNVGNTGNTAGGAPPAYPGMANRPIPNGNGAPPAYSPSMNMPPAYNPAYNRPSYANQPAYKPNSYNTYASNPGYNSYSGYNTRSNYPAYGSTFGSGGLGGNTYIHNNYYGGSRSSPSSFLTNALFYGVGMHHGYMWGGYNNRRSWDSEDDRRWRATTKAPYFENKVPGLH